MNIENLSLAGKIISPSYAQQAAEVRKGFENRVRQLLEQVFLFQCTLHKLLMYCRPFN